ncbi:hypothetical protein E4U54_008319, partial [Claviceps lovelessii]
MFPEMGVCPEAAGPACRVDNLDAAADAPVAALQVRQAGILTGAPGLRSRAQGIWSVTSMFSSPGTSSTGASPATRRIPPL